MVGGCRGGPCRERVSRGGLLWVEHQEIVAGTGWCLWYLSTACLSGWVWKGCGDAGGGGADTLLGPEGSGFAGDGRVWLPLVVRGSGAFHLYGWWVLGWAWSYVENCTVDASIFVAFKFLRAHGGCLGTRNRRRT